MVALRGFAEAWAPLALTITWQLGLLAVLVWVCEWALRLRHARVRHTLWWFVLLAPFLLTPARKALERHHAVLTLQAPRPVAHLLEATGSLGPIAATQAATETAAPLSPLAVGPSTPAREPASHPARSDIPLSAAFMAAWLIGCTIVAARLLLGHRELMRTLAASRPVTDGGVLRTLGALCGDARVGRKVSLRSSRSLSAPLLYGLREPVILMPEKWLISLSPDDLGVVLAHEAAHIERGDLLGNLLQRIAELPLFFHPAAWLAGRRIMLAREELCDAAALRPGVDPKGYALSLLAAAEKTRATHAVACVGVAEGKFTLLRRVEAIMGTANVKGLSGATAIGLTLVLLAATAVLTSAQVRAESATVALNAAEGSAGGVDSGGDGVPGMPETTAAQGGAPRTAAPEGATPSSGGGGGGGRHGLPDEEPRYPAEAVHVRSNMQRLGLAMRGYLTAHDGVFPGGRSAGDLLRTLGPYLTPERLLVHGASGDPLTVQYLLRSGAAIPPAEARETAFAEATYGATRGLLFTAYADGHVGMKRAGEGGSGGGGWAVGGVVSNMEQLALAMRAYLADHDAKAPPASDVQTALKELEPYLEPRLLFLRPGTRDEVVQYVMEPGTNWSDLSGRRAPRAPVFVADYAPEFTVIVSASMGASIELKKGVPAP